MPYNMQLKDLRKYSYHQNNVNNETQIYIVIVLMSVRLNIYWPLIEQIAHSICASILNNRKYKNKLTIKENNVYKVGKIILYAFEKWKFFYKKKIFFLYTCMHMTYDFRVYVYLPNKLLKHFMKLYAYTIEIYMCLLFIYVLYIFIFLL